MTIITHFFDEFEIQQCDGGTQIGKKLIPHTYVSATQMCKANKKKLADFARLKSTKEYWEAVSADVGIPVSGLVIEVEGSLNGDASTQGTWVELEIALDLAK
ncbi:KilA-N domain-containing protein [Nodularia phage vB_NspS-kac65v162]|jgi:hypothetical protein|uniref:KilA-N domain-containing protein n=3 Tax=Ravarandavirus kac65v151 TaxID=2845689 RepID=A0A482MH84_9CAUD|nr:transcriptional regulator [Nodularia phage vB_NspS-kac65v151]QBQ73093.1 KilA-N domain-containing protein [Nodularia phage vB_NspS-kac65v151]QBQ73301.1 KilA-N domain-containing protein [Nodularia phage vB_NspS-kac65v161]QBQ73507.1 KilA-N domain-containing protein [Nodularia phage vB_NspS-kac65v162]